MSKWNETGILRRKPVRDNFDDLLVFGYACKLFRDDDKALYIDQGKHLIPWMGDEKLKIDRYDGRGALSDLSRCEASKEGYDATRWMGLSESERKIEQLCDEDRYYSLHTNEEEDALYKEEELKRKQANEFQYSYDVPGDPDQENSQDSIPTCEEEVIPFVPSTDLDVPVDITIPTTLKENARIEKTALFVSKQGPQMEILIKAKQADNPQFSFMNQSDPLYKYYRHVLSAIKAGRYKPECDNEGAAEEEKQNDSIADDEHYLHPSLVQAQAPPSVLSTSVPYKPTADCSYTQLITRIQGNNAPPKDDPKPSQAAMTQDQQQQYYQYYYSMQYYEYYKQIAQQYASQAGCDPSTILQNPQLQEQIQNQASHYAQAACSQYMQQSSTNQYAQLVNNLASNIRHSPTPSEPAPPPPADPEPRPPKPEPKPKPNPLASLVHYSSDSEEEEEAEEEVKVAIKVPPGDTALIIDKMANYVSKNGVDFEKIVSAKGDPRFDFLKETHEYYNYYKQKVDEYREADTEKKPKDKKVIVPVCFSIKNPKEGSPKEIKSALPVEESDEDADEARSQNGCATPPPPIVSVVVTQKPAVEVKPIVVALPSPTVAVIEEVVTPVNAEATTKEEPTTNGKYIDADDPILEMIDLTDDLEDRRDVKRAENKVKDKLVSAAKDKLASRSLQLERRRRAAMFLKMKSGNGEGETRTITRVEDKRNGEERLSEGTRREKDKDEILHIEDSETEDGEIRHKHRSSKKKKSHKRSRHESSKSHRKKSKKRRRRSSSRSSNSSS